MRTFSDTTATTSTSVTTSTDEYRALCDKAVADAWLRLGPERLKAVEDACEIVRRAARYYYEDKAMLCCIPIAKALVMLLKTSGIDSVPVIGHAAWRVGAGDNDCVRHGDNESDALIGGAIDGHAWVAADVDGEVVFIDATTAFLREKVAEMDKVDGQTSNVEWAPDQLIFKGFSVVLDAATEAPDAGVFAYQPHLSPNSPLVPFFKEADKGGDFRRMAALLAVNPDMIVVCA